MSSYKPSPLGNICNILQGGANNTSIWWPDSIKQPYNDMRLGNSELLSAYRDRIISLTNEVICTEYAMMFCFLKYDIGGNLSGASCIAMLSENKYIIDAEESDLEYIRVDFDDCNLGTLLSHHFPHMHYGKKQTIRFPMYKSSTTPIIDFVEMIIIQTDLQQWIKWASHNITDGSATSEQVEENLNDLATKWKENTFFQNANTGQLRNYMKQLRRLKLSIHPKFTKSIRDKLGLLNYV